MSLSDIGATDPSDSGSVDRLSVVGVLTAVVRRVRTDPFLCVPFSIAGVVVALADWLRVRDPLPAAEPAWTGDTVSVQFSLFPSGTARTTRELGALVDLKLPYLLGGVTLEAAAALAVGIAGWVTVTRGLSADRSAGSGLRYVGGLTVVSTLLVLVPARELELGSLPLALLALVVVFLLVVRVFLFPGLLAADRGFVAALRRSVRLSRGVQWSLFWLALALGVTSWGLATVPVVGGFLSTAVVGTVHAVGLAVLLGRLDADDTVSNGGPERL